MKIIWRKILTQIQQKEAQLAEHTTPTSEEAFQMTIFLNAMLQQTKLRLLENNFIDTQQEIDFFKNIKPQILGKLIYYNKVFRIETACPVNNGKIYQNYFEYHLKLLKTEYKESICNDDFYRYFRAGRIDRDERYFTLGQINYHDGLKSNVFEIDIGFSTYYDNKIAHILANELLYTYILAKINPEVHPDSILLHGDTHKEIAWTNSQNALIELIYALYASNSISHGKMGIQKLALIFKVLFRTSLNDVHHSFHRMKTRAGSRTAFLDQLKKTLEEYMDKEL